MPNPQSEEALERRRAAIRASVARHKAEMDRLTRAEQAAWKARKSLGDAFEPYTPEERAEVERIQDLAAELESAALSLSRILVRRYRAAVEADPSLKPILEALEEGRGTHVALPAF